MIKEIAWNTFKNTGSINTFLELKQIENFQNNICNNQKVSLKADNEKNQTMGKSLNNICYESKIDCKYL